MKKISKVLMGSLVLAVVCVFAAGGPAQAVLYDFNGLGESGTPSLPAGWTLWRLDTNDAGGTGDATKWGTSIPASGTYGVQTMAQSSTTNALSSLIDSATGITSSTKDDDQWYNIARESTPTNRVISTSPTSNVGMAFQLTLTNDTGGTLNNIVLSYDLIKFYNGLYLTDTSKRETIIGYQLFYALGSTSGTWTNVSDLNPTSAHIPQPATDGSRTYSTHSFTNYVLPLTWNNGQNLYLRWVDDNADLLSPDQIIGIDNVVVTPIPAAVWLLGSGLVGLVAIRRRMRK